MLKEHRDKISDADAKTVEEAIEETKKAMREGGIDRINAANEKLTTASHKLAEAMYRATAAAGASAPGGQTQESPPSNGSKPKDNVVDAEFVDVDDKK
jgi:molecular chaperone DnaK